MCWNCPSRSGEPVISVGTRKKELIGDYKNGGSEYRTTGCPDKVKVHGFVDKDLGKVAPYGILAPYRQNNDRIDTGNEAMQRNAAARIAPDHQFSIAAFDGSSDERTVGQDLDRLHR